MAVFPVYSLQEVQQVLKLNNRQLKKWLDALKIEPTISQTDSRKREISYQQYRQLEAAVNKYQEMHVPDVVDLQKRVEQLESQLQEVYTLLKGRGGQTQGIEGVSKKELARLAVAHGGKLGTAEKWDWPLEARANCRASLLYIQARFASGIKPHGLQECDDATCECHELVSK